MSQNYVYNIENTETCLSALQWYLDNGVDELLGAEPTDRTVMPELPKLSAPVIQGKITPQAGMTVQNTNITAVDRLKLAGQQDTVQAQEMMGAAQAIVEAQKIAAACHNLEELAAAIEGFEGLSIRKTASHMVFADGQAGSPVMVIGEAPSADDDIAGKPFMGAAGQLQDKILASIGLSRKGGGGEAPDNKEYRSVYLSNILNWRPPGNRTPTSAEIDISLPFIERHIALVQPKALIFCGGLVGKALLRRSDPISKLRGDFYDYKVPENLGGSALSSITAMVTYHPDYLLKTPAQKRAVWTDMLMFKDKLSHILP